MVLLQIDEGGHFVPGLLQQVKAVDLAVTMKQPPDLPGYPLGNHALANTEPVEDFQRALCPANGPGANRHHIVVVQYNRAHAMQRQVNCGAEPDRSGTDDGNRIEVSGFARQFRWRRVVERLVVVPAHQSTLQRFPHLLVASLQSRCAAYQHRGLRRKRAPR